jgi:hypothetical protein
MHILYVIGMNQTLLYVKRIIMHVTLNEKIN